MVKRGFIRIPDDDSMDLDYIMRIISSQHYCPPPSREESSEYIGFIPSCYNPKQGKTISERLNTIEQFIGLNYKDFDPNNFSLLEQYRILSERIDDLSEDSSKKTVKSPTHRIKNIRKRRY